DFGVEDEEAVDFEQDSPEERFFPVEPPPFEATAPADNFDSPDNNTEIVEPAPGEPEPFRSRRGNLSCPFGNSLRNFSRPTLPSRPGASSAGFGKSAGQVQFKKTGQEQDQLADSLELKKKNLKSLKDQYQNTFGK